MKENTVVVYQKPTRSLSRIDTPCVYSVRVGTPITHKHILLKFGERVHRVRKAKGITQEELAVKLFMHKNYIGMIERGERNPTIRTLYKLAKALTVNASELLPF